MQRGTEMMKERGFEAANKTQQLWGDGSNLRLQMQT